MGFMYRAPKGTQFNGAAIPQSGYLEHPFHPEDASVGIVMFGGLSPSLMPNSQQFPDLQEFRNVKAVFYANGIAVYRKSILTQNELIVLSEEAAVAMASVWGAFGKAPESLSSFVLRVFGPVGQGVYWYPWLVGYDL